MTPGLFVYGTLQPGGVNEHVLATIEGSWQPGSVRGRLLDEGWGASHGCPGIVLEADGPEVNGFLFSSAALPAHWPELDRFEGEEYVRVVTNVLLESGETVTAEIYVLKDGN